MIPEKFEGTIYIYWHVKAGFLYFTRFSDIKDEHYILVGETDVSVPLSGARATDNALATIDREIDKARSAIEILQEQKQSLLEHVEGAA